MAEISSAAYPLFVKEVGAQQHHQQFDLKSPRGYDTPSGRQTIPLQKFFL